MALFKRTGTHISTNEIIDIAKRQGYGFSASVEFDVPSSDSLETIFVTGEKPVIFYSRLISYYGDGLDTYVYRDATYTSGSQDIETYSSNDVIKHDSLSYFVSGATITNGGELTRPKIPVSGNTSNQGNGSALQAIDEPILMLPNSIYRFVITNRDTTSSQGGSSVVSFGEPDQIPGIVLDAAGNFVRYNGQIL